MLEEIKEKGWILNLSFQKEATICFIYTATRKELGFAKVNGFQTDYSELVSTAYQRAIENERRTSELLEKRKKVQPLLYEEDI